MPPAAAKTEAADRCHPTTAIIKKMVSTLTLSVLIGFHNRPIYCLSLELSHKSFSNHLSPKLRVIAEHLIDAHLNSASPPPSSFLLAQTGAQSERNKAQSKINRDTKVVMGSQLTNSFGLGVNCHSQLIWTQYCGVQTNSKRRWTPTHSDSEYTQAQNSFPLKTHMDSGLT